ncbi:MAG: hypothetical protein MJZ66_09480 [Bacteroidales bacterium]|nr:hypothetical protein [Bacteroidales bacterium]
MKKNIIILLINGLLCLCSCGDFWAKTGQDTGQSTGESNHDPLTQSSSEADYLEKVDEYVNSIRENIEQTSIVKKETAQEKTVLFMKDSDTIKISVLGDKEASTDIYFKNSTPVFMTRHIILDVDSNYLETAYLKDGKIFKCFRNGVEIKDPGYLKQFEETLGDK